MIDRIAESWIFHSLIRTVALVIIALSGYHLLTYSETGYASDNAVVVKSASDTLPGESAEKPAGQLSIAVTQENGGGKGATAEPPLDVKEWPVEENELSVDGVLVPKKETVISSSHDGRISNIPLENGDRFKRNDILVRYDCSDIEAEAEVAGIQKKLTETKAKSGEQLFKLDIISDLDRMNIQTEDKQADAKMRMYESRLNDCVIRAEFNGRVTKRLANEGEYTRTDRVLMEVASDDPMNIEFLLPSKWLRWVNIGAPLTITVNETGNAYTAKVVRIFGAIDPVSQSIQVRAALDPYKDRLMSGMSGKVTIDVQKIKDSGVYGYLAVSDAP